MNLHVESICYEWQATQEHQQCAITCILYMFVVTVKTLSISIKFSVNGHFIFHRVGSSVEMNEYCHRDFDMRFFVCLFE